MTQHVQFPTRTIAVSWCRRRLHTRTSCIYHELSSFLFHIIKLNTHRCDSRVK